MKKRHLLRRSDLLAFLKPCEELLGPENPNTAKLLNKLDAEKLPETVTELTDDPYRALAWAVRKRGGLDKTKGSLDEFKWANFFRSRLPIGSQPGDFLCELQRIPS